MNCYRGQILDGTQQRLKAQTNLSAQDAAAALAAASFLDQLNCSQVILPAGACNALLSSLSMYVCSQILSYLHQIITSISTAQQSMLLRLLLQRPQCADEMSADKHCIAKQQVSFLCDLCIRHFPLHD